MTDSTPAEKAAAPGSHPLDAYVTQLYTDWCECSPYGDQVPDEWADLMSSFANEHAGKSPSEMAELIMEASPTDTFEKLLSNIFQTAACFVIHDLSNAVYDRNFAKLRLIGLDENTECSRPSAATLG